MSIKGLPENWTAQDAKDADAILAKLKPGEPFFVLRGQDWLAAGLVERWAENAARFGCPEERLLEAQRHADAMRKWGNLHGKYPD